MTNRLPIPLLLGGVSGNVSVEDLSFVGVTGPIEESVWVGLGFVSLLLDASETSRCKILSNFSGVAVDCFDVDEFVFGILFIGVAEARVCMVFRSHRLSAYSVMSNLCAIIIQTKACFLLIYWIDCITDEIAGGKLIH